MLVLSLKYDICEAFVVWCTLPEQKNMLEALTEELGINTQGFFEKEW